MSISKDAYSTDQEDRLLQVGLVLHLLLIWAGRTTCKTSGCLATPPPAVFLGQMCLRYTLQTTASPGQRPRLATSDPVCIGSCSNALSTYVSAHSTCSEPMVTNSLRLLTAGCNLLSMWRTTSQVGAVLVKFDPAVMLLCSAEFLLSLTVQSVCPPQVHHPALDRICNLAASKVTA